MEAQGPYDLKRLPEQSHAEAPLLNYIKKNGVPVSMPRGMTEEIIGKVLAYGAHSSANKERNFVRK